MQGIEVNNLSRCVLRVVVIVVDDVKCNECGSDASGVLFVCIWMYSASESASLR